MRVYHEHTYNTCIRTIRAYVQYVRTYNTCVGSIRAYVQYVRRFNTCVHTIRAYVQYVRTYNTCVRTIHAVRACTPISYSFTVGVGGDGGRLGDTLASY